MNSPSKLRLCRGAGSTRAGADLLRPIGPALALVLLAVSAQPAVAQQSLTDVLTFLLTNRSIATDDFVQDAQAAAATSDAIADSVLLGLATLPLGSSASGFTYRVDQSLGGAIVRSSSSFGPIFTERTLTAGRSRGSLGVSYQGAAFDAIDGRNLRDGTLVATASTCCANPIPFDVETLSLRIRSDSATLSGNYGLSDRVDIGAAISLVRISIRGERVDTYRGQRLLQASATSSATGVGDLVLRVKYNLMRSSGTGLAIGAETRLPTGDEENLLGTGKTAVKPRIIWSLENNGVAVDTELGYSFGGLSDELTYGGAITVVGAPKLMFIGELSGRRLGSVGRLTETTSKHPSLVGVETIRLSAVDEAGQRLVAIGGIKWNPGATWLVGANVLRRITTGGLTAQWVPMVSIEYAFGG